ncbi:hypothetical protein SEA_LASTHOPE_62 [Mycobacterium phage LastHope]|uniref:Uncharacterized protein n=1 Tax=Mycobacterium phage LastHope TaxID=2015886 RepID=A0A222ZTB4_9CAUD|nr:hypothetical protein I5G99_gp046 [Mycobacterium phage LastHope]ASR87230.1 hypothetical protein SEA_LASTHOPE_62 [Mycobacterium phage LastHope]
MSNNNFVHVGKVSVPTGRKLVWPDSGVEAVEVVVGVRADLGEVVVSIDGKRNGTLPSLTAGQAAELAVHLERAAGVASSLAEAYRTYQDALKSAEVDLAQAFAREAGA